MTRGADSKGGQAPITSWGPLGALEPLRSASTAGLIAERIRAAIMDGILAPGTQLGEADLAGRLKVSRGPVREALQRLVQEGILIARPNRGVFVPRLGRDDVADVYLARTAVETAAAMAVMERGATGTGRAADVLRDLESAVGGGHWSAAARLDLEFHQELVRASGSARLERMAAPLIVESRLCLTALDGAYRAPTDLAAEHRALFDAVQRCDRPRAVERITGHMRGAAGRLGELLAGQDGDARHPPARTPPASAHRGHLERTVTQGC